MRLSALPIATLKETPADAELASHRLMLRAGLIRKLAAGLYTWMPLGLRVLRKVEKVVREEMDRAGGLEVLMPAVQPAELWRETERWEQFGPQLLRMTDRHQREFCFGPTHEEVITDIARRDLRSYKQLPAVYYQIQTKFRDEIRPRFGVMRAREFIMKDAYSFHLGQDDLGETYHRLYAAYTQIFTRLGLHFRAVHADSGNIGGNLSHEFHVLADSGEDAIAFASEGDYAANTELAEAVAPATPRPAPGAAMEQVATPDARTISAITELLGVPASQCLKTLLVRGEKGGVVALVLRGDHELNLLKAGKHPLVAAPCTLADAAMVREAADCDAGYIGPPGLDCPIIADRSALVTADFVCGANVNDAHLRNVNWGRDLPEAEAADLRTVQEGDPSPDGRGTLSIARGIEVGHIFDLGQKYSIAMGATVLDQNGRSQPLYMGCYGVGVSRIVAAAIEQNHDERGIIWPTAMAPFSVALVPLNWNKSARVREAAEKLYAELLDAGFEVLLDDRDARPGVKFADIELLGIPHRVVIAERGLDAGELEYKGRSDDATQQVAYADIQEFLASR